MHVAEWCLDNKHGEGTFRWQAAPGPIAGAFYCGAFKNGVIEGKGKTIFTDGSTYEGSYVDGQRQGHGTFTSSDGTVEDGEWACGRRIDLPYETSANDVSLEAAAPAADVPIFEYIRTRQQQQQKFPTLRNPTPTSSAASSARASKAGPTRAHRLALPRSAMPVLPEEGHQMAC